MASLFVTESKLMEFSPFSNTNDSVVDSPRIEKKYIFYFPPNI